MGKISNGLRLTLQSQNCSRTKSYGTMSGAVICCSSGTYTWGCAPRQIMDLHTFVVITGFDIRMEQTGSLGHVLLSLVWPFLAAYTNALSWSMAHMSGIALDQTVAQLRKMTMQERPDLPADCLSADTIKNAIATFKDMGVVTKSDTGLLDIWSVYCMPWCKNYFVVAQLTYVCCSVNNDVTALSSQLIAASARIRAQFGRSAAKL